MAFQIHWTPIAESSFADEIDFILKKWNLKEVNKFILLTEDNINLLSTNPNIGSFSSERSICSFVVSKQTTLFYKVFPDENRIDLVLFWNNKRNPKDLFKLLLSS